MTADQRSQEAEQLLARSFEARQHKPAMFALLCDELTEAVVAGRLAEPLKHWIKTSATDQLEAFLDDYAHDLPAVQVRPRQCQADQDQLLPVLHVDPQGEILAATAWPCYGFSCNVCMLVNTAQLELLPCMSSIVMELPRTAA